MELRIKYFQLIMIINFMEFVWSNRYQVYFFLDVLVLIGKLFFSPSTRGSWTPLFAKYYIKKAKYRGSVSDDQVCD